MEEQAQVRGVLQHTGGTSALSVWRSIARELTASSQSSLSGTIDILGKSRAVSNIYPVTSSHAYLEFPHSI